MSDTSTNQSAQPAIHLSGFPWEDAAWRYVAILGNFYAYASTPEQASSDVIELAR